jgi:eukaryotic-like serine/threonine-protein kinase
VLITKYGEIKIVDFGLAKASSQLEKSEPGIIKGKFSYLAPEAALGRDVDARADIFAVGTILWEMLSGRRLFLGDTDFATVKLVQQAAVPSLSKVNPNVPPALDDIVARSLARDPAQRFQTARELAIALNTFLFQQGRAVGSFRIAQLVQSAIREKQRSRHAQPSIIDKLIEEALFEFTSLQAGDDAPSKGKDPVVGAAPLSLDRFQQARDWVSEISVEKNAGVPQDRPSPFSGQADYTAGNLAALEGEDELPSFASSDSAGSGFDSLPPPEPIAAAEISEPSRPAFSMKKKRGSREAVVFVVILVVLAVVAGAYYTGLLPGVTPPR